jgi:hypothetical protein
MWQNAMGHAPRRIHRDIVRSVAAFTTISGQRISSCQFSLAD